MARSRDLRIEISGDPRSFNRSLGSINKTIAHTEGRMSRFGRVGGAALLGLGAVAGGGLVIGFKKAIDAAAEAERVMAQTQAVLKSTGGVAKVTATDVTTLADALSRKSGIDDEAIQSAENLLLTFTKVRNETGKGNDIFSQATSAITDMSVAMGTDLQSATLQVGKALNDPVKGITALRRVGVQFTADQQTMVAGWVEHGKTLKAQKFILRELTTEFGGSAKAAGNTFSGQMNKAKVAAENLGESVGRAVIPSLSKGAAAVAKFVDQMRTGTGAGGKFAHAMKTAFGAVSNAVSVAIGSIRKFLHRNRDDIEAAGKAFRNLGRAATWAFTDVLLPVVKRVMPGVRQMVQGTLKTLTGIIRVFTGVLTGDWSLAWKGLKGIVSGAVKSWGGAIRAGSAPMRQAATWAFGAVSKVVDNTLGRVLRTIKSLIENILNLITDVKAQVPSLQDFVPNLGGSSKGFDMVVGGHASGGLIHGQGRGDTVPAMLEPGEFVMRRRVVDKFGPTFFANLNEGGGGRMKGGVARFGNGGIVALGQQLQSMGYSVGEHPAFGGVHPVHSTNSYHYRGMALDINADGRPGGEGKWLDRLYGMLRGKPGIKELLWRVKDHYDHLHVAMAGNANPLGGGAGGGGRSATGSFTLKGLAQLALNAGFSKKQAATMAAIAMAESSGNPLAVGDGGDSFGLWQINKPSHPGAHNLRSPTMNAKVARQIFQSQGLSAWSVYNSGAYRQYLGGATRAAQNLSPGTPASAIGQRAPKMPHGAFGTPLPLYRPPKIGSLKAMPGYNFLADSRHAEGNLASLAEQGGTAIGQYNRYAGLTDEDLGTAAGRKAALQELTIKKFLQTTNVLAAHQAQVAEAKKRITFHRGQIKALRGRLKSAKGGNVKASIRKDIAAHQTAILKLKAHIRTLGGQIADDKLDIAETDAEMAAVAATPDSETTAGGTWLTAQLAYMDARVRAGELTEAEALAGRKGLLEKAVAADSPLSAAERLEFKGQLNELTSTTPSLAGMLTADEKSGIEALDAAAALAVTTESGADDFTAASNTRAFWQGVYDRLKASGAPQSVLTEVLQQIGAPLANPQQADEDAKKAQQDRLNFINAETGRLNAAWGYTGAMSRDLGYTVVNLNSVFPPTVEQAKQAAAGVVSGLSYQGATTAPRVSV